MIRILSLLLLGAGMVRAAEPLIIDHRHVDIRKRTTAEIQLAKKVLHIGYGHTSHGSQITGGMKGLVRFADNRGLGLNHPRGIFRFSAGGANGTLDLREGGKYGDASLSRDCGVFPHWEDETRRYLKDPANRDVNVMMWSWCGQMPGKFKSGRLDTEYLEPMARLEKEFPHVIFVYMTGHTDIRQHESHRKACEHIRTYCLENGKVLYDFADIENHSPDGAFHPYVNDNCDVYADASGRQKIGNWALEFQEAHGEGIAWYRCSSAHSQPVNANLKAYAAWALWCELAKRVEK